MAEERSFEQRFWQRLFYKRFKIVETICVFVAKLQSYVNYFGVDLSVKNIFCVVITLWKWTTT